jgi:hypothetical protein
MPKICREGVSKGLIYFVSFEPRLNSILTEMQANIRSFTYK